MAVGQQAAPSAPVTDDAESTSETQNADTPQNKAPELFVPVTENLLSRLQQQNTAAFADEPPIRHLQIRGSLVSTDTISGSLELELDSNAVGSKSLLSAGFGQTNLQLLKLKSQAVPINIASDEQGQPDPPVQASLAGCDGHVDQIGNQNRPVNHLPVSTASRGSLRVRLYDRCSNRGHKPQRHGACGQNNACPNTLEAPSGQECRAHNQLCSTAADQQLNDLYLDLATSAKVDSSQATLTWVVTAPPAFSRQTINFKVTRPCK